MTDPSEEGIRQHRFVAPPGATTVLVVRHGESEAEVPGKPFELRDGHGDPALHPVGERQAELLEAYRAPGRLAAKEKEFPITGPSALVEAILELGRKGVTVQRYKGLGEMNPDQLWETTLDPDARSLLQVRVSHADSAEETFSTLMGDLVEPRREFIQTNALNVANLDV
jgi:DNA gyrase/topoisomerase IV subunit B